LGSTFCIKAKGGKDRSAGMTAIKKKLTPEELHPTEWKTSPRKDSKRIEAYSIVPAVKK
jgi:hypothetical protein